MTPELLLGIFFGVIAVGLVAWLQAQLLIRAYKEGYLRGRKESAEWCSNWWSKVEKQVEETRQEIKDQERWP